MSKIIREFRECFAFFHIKHYLPLRLSYAKFLEAFDVEDSNAFSPYEWFDSDGRLEATGLNPIGQDWFSTLKEKSLSKDGRNSPDAHTRNTTNVTNARLWITGVRR